MNLYVLFWTLVVFVFYVYLGYPVLVWWFARRITPRSVSAIQPRNLPTVEIIVPMHNEGSHVLRKIQNLRDLDYPESRRSITIVSDGSTDVTLSLLTSQPDVKVIEIPIRRGKPHALNLAVAQSNAQIIVFADARQELAVDAVKVLVERLFDSTIGAVSGALCHRSAGSNTASDFGLYWRYEKWVRACESRLHSTVGVTGALYAIRRELYRPIAEDALLDDVEIPLEILRQERRVVLAEDAKVFDVLSESHRTEWDRKVRTLSGNFQVFRRHLWLFSPFTNPVFWQFLSHKVLRLVVPYALMALLILPWFLSGSIYPVIGMLEVALWGGGLAGVIVGKLRRWRAVSFLASFLVLNGAAVAALWCFLTGSMDVRWRKV